MKAPFIVGITGGSGSGKTYFIDELVKKIPSNLVCQISQDNYYKTIDSVPVDKNGIKNFDLPEAIDFNSFINDVRKLLAGKEAVLQEYTFNNNSKSPKEIKLIPAPLIFVEGIFTFTETNLNQLFNLKIFIEAPDIVKIKRRIIRDAIERGYNMEDVLYRYENHVQPSFNTYIEPHRQSADFIIPNSHDMVNAIDVIASYLNEKLKIH